MYPVCLHIADQLCVVLGGGHVAERKARGLLEAGARVRVVSPECSAGLQCLAGQGLLEWRRKMYDSADLEGARLVFAATSDALVQQTILRDAHRQGLLVNSADAPKACDFHLPASVRRGDLLLSVSTGGRSPALAAMIRKDLAVDFGPEYAMLVELMGRVRDCALQGQWSGERKQKIFASLMDVDVRDWLKSGQTNRVRRRVRELLAAEAECVNLDFLGTEGL